ncbi:hypothetical protein [Streptomyces sp. NPDC096152]|uniref:hypothetical protein n=1 Tax=Streptomyces sp. NPDC096152 TaxID=3366078 RepID=UPI0038153773
MAWRRRMRERVLSEARERAEAADPAVRLTLSHVLLPATRPEATPAQVSRAVWAVLGVPARG